MSEPIPFPGPVALGRGLVVEPGDAIPDPAGHWPVLTIDAAALAEPAESIDRLDDWWRNRTPSVVALAVPFADLRRPESSNSAPYRLDPRFEFSRERLHFLTWANRYDGRGGRLRWHHGERAAALGAGPGAGDSGDVLAEGEPVWIDGGPRTHRSDDLAVVHVESVWSGLLSPDRSRQPTTDLAADQLAAVAHSGGPARVIAPAGSGKTRVLTERMRHILADRGWNSDAVTALAYNRRAAQEMRERLADVGETHVRTLHAFGYEIVGRARGRRPRLLAERDVRRILDRLAPLRPRANEDVHAPYLEALAEVRTALRHPEGVERDRDDVPGLAALFEPFRQEMAAQGAMDHDEQIYAAIEALLADHELRSWAQARCRHLLVDEFQDLTAAHLLLVRLLAAPAYDVFGVGDDDQVIYGYAGASPEYLIDYDRYFPGADHHQLHVNYRCPAPVVAAATTLLGYNRRRLPKEIHAASTASSGLEVVRVPEAAMGNSLVDLVAGLTTASGPQSVAILTRVNVGLLVPQLTLAEAGLPAQSILDSSLLDRSGVRAALAWLRLGEAVAAGAPMAGPDLAEAARRPPRNLSPGVRRALGNGQWTIERLASFADGSSDDRTRDRLGSLVEAIFDLSTVVGDGGRTARQLTAIRDQVGLGGVLERLDNSRARPTGGHTDDLDALIVLAHTHPEVDGFERWLRSSLERPPVEGPSVTLSTVHRVKGLEWPHVVVWDASAGVMPHRLATEVEEERRIFHVALTRCSQSVTFIARAESVSPFVSQLTRPATEAKTEKVPPATRQAETGMRVQWQGFAATITEIESEAAVVSVGSVSRMRIRWGEVVTIEGRRFHLTAPAGPAADPILLDRLKDWRRRRAGADRVPPYVVAHDSHLEDIAARRPGTLEQLARCDGIGPSRLEKYGDEILSVILPGEALSAPAVDAAPVVPAPPPAS